MVRFGPDDDLNASAGTGLGSWRVRHDGQLTASTPCAVDGSTLDTVIECLRTTLGVPGLPSAQDVRGTAFEQLYGFPVTFTVREGYLYYGEIDRIWQFAAQPLPSTAARARIVVRADPAS